MPGKKKEAKSSSDASGKKKAGQSKSKAIDTKKTKSATADKKRAGSAGVPNAQAGSAAWAPSKLAFSAVHSKPAAGFSATESQDFGASEFSALFDQIDSKYHDYLKSVMSHPIRQFQQSTVDDYLKLIHEIGLPRAAAAAIDCRDYTRGSAWEQASMNIMNAIMPPPRLLNELLKQAVAMSCLEAIKWYPEASENPKEIIEVLRPVLSDKEPKNRWWAAIHLSRHLHEPDELVDILIESIQSNWIAFKLENSSSGMSGRGEAAKALARLGKNAARAREPLYAQLDSGKIESADAAQIAGALLSITGEVDEIMAKVSKIAEGVLTERRGLELHGGDRELLITLKNLITKWKQADKARSDEMNAKVELLEKEIKYHLSL